MAGSGNAQPQDHYIGFTTTASSGDGSFINAYNNACQNVVYNDTYIFYPDTDVFTSPNATSTILITEEIICGCNAKIDCSLRRIRFSGANGTTRFFSNKNTTYNTTFINCEIVNFNSSESVPLPLIGNALGRLNLIQCRITGNSGFNSAIGTYDVRTRASTPDPPQVYIESCAIYGNNFTNAAIEITNDGEGIINYSTIVGNTSCDVSSVVSFSGEYNYDSVGNFVLLNHSICNSTNDETNNPVITTNNSVVGASSTIGFVTAPPNSYTTFDKDDWLDWNLHLTSSSSYADSCVYNSVDSGLPSDGYTVQSNADCEGTRRYASSGSINSGSIGAYETIVADYYYYAEPTGASSGWSLSRFGTIVANLKPSDGSTCFIEGHGEINFDGVEDITLIIAGYSVIEIDNVSIKFVPNDLFPYECSVVQGENTYRDVRFLAFQSALLSPWQPIGKRSGYDHTLGCLVVNRYSVDESYEYINYSIQVDVETTYYLREALYDYGDSLYSPTGDLYDDSFNITDASLLDSGVNLSEIVEFNANFLFEELVTNKIIVKGLSASWNDYINLNKIIEVQKYGNLYLWRSLTLIENGAIQINGGRVFVGEDIQLDGGTIDFIGNNDTSVLYLPWQFDFNNYDSGTTFEDVLLNTENFLANSTHGYLVIGYHGVFDLSSLSLSNDIIVCYYNALISDCEASGNDDITTVDLEWVDGNEYSQTVCIEYRNASDTHFTLIDATHSSTPDSNNEYEIELEPARENRVFRIFGGLYFHDITVETTYVQINAEYRMEALENMNLSDTIDPSKNLIVVAQLKLLGQYLTVGDISSIKLTVAKKGDNDQYASVSDYTNLSVDNNCVIQLATADAWTSDSSGFNFIWVSDEPGYGEVEIPDYLSVAGDYQLQFTFNLTNDRDAQTLTIPFTVPE